MSFRFSNDGSVIHSVQLATGDTLQYRAKDVRRERTGLHALIALAMEQRILATDVFNVGRNEDRQRLAKSAHAMLGAMLKGVYSLEELKHDLDIFCLSLEKAWEERFEIETLDGAGPVGPMEFTLRPYLLREGGTILFAPPGQGKSYVALLQAQSINTGTTKLWPVQQRKVLFVNLERPARSLKRRMVGINHALGLPATATLQFLNARGMSLKDVAASVRKAVRNGNVECIFLDSISRAGMGSLLDDETANSTVDLLNNICPTWLAIGHTPRDNVDHVFGSQHFDAGIDIGVKLSSERGENELGICLKMTKANDVAYPKPWYMSLRFEQDLLVAAEAADSTAFPRLAADGKSAIQQIEEFLLDANEATTTQIAEALQMPASNISKYLHDGNGRFVFTHQEGRERFYGLQTRRTDGL